MINECIEPLQSTRKVHPRSAANIVKIALLNARIEDSPWQLPSSLLMITPLFVSLCWVGWLGYEVEVLSMLI